MSAATAAQSVGVDRHGAVVVDGVEDLVAARSAVSARTSMRA